METIYYNVTKVFNGKKNKFFYVFYIYFFKIVINSYRQVHWDYIAMQL